jgi:hypothetical protein
MWQRRLLRGLWLWPDASEDAARVARHFVVALPVGDGSAALLSQTAQDRADLWRFPPFASDPDCDLATLAPSSANALHNAIAAVKVAVPALYPAALVKLERQQLQHVTGAVGNGAIAVVTGESFGLALALAAGACALRATIPEDLIALGSVTPDGKVVDVEISAKLRLVAEQTWRVRRALVSRDQVQLARHLLDQFQRQDVAVLGVATVAEALEIAFGPEVAELPIRAAKESASERERIARRLRIMLHRGYSAATSWHAVGACCQAALRQWDGQLSTEQRHELSFMAAVFGRHAGTSGATPLPPVDWWRALPFAAKTMAAAHYLQHASDFGLGVHAEIVDFVAEHTVTVESLDAVRMGGALARSLQLDPHHQSAALVLFRRITEFAVSELMVDDISRSLCGWLRLAGAVQDHAEFDAATRCAGELLTDEVLVGVDRDFVAVAAGAGAALLGDVVAARSHLSGFRSPVTWLCATGLRCLALAEAQTGNAAEAAALRALLLAGAESDVEWRWFAALADLDRALDGQGNGVEELAAFLAMKPQGGLALAGLDPGAVARFYPY